VEGIAWSSWRLLIAVLVALAVPLVGAGEARGQVRPAVPTAEEVLGDSLARIARVVRDTERRIDTQVERAVFRIEVLRARGASEAAVQRAAAKLRTLPAAEGRRGVAMLNREVGRAMIRMRRAPGYERQLQDTLFFERDRAVEAMRLAVEEGRAAIDAAASPGG
jgi:hypothetical protein